MSRNEDTILSVKTREEIELKGSKPKKFEELTFKEQTPVLIVLFYKTEKEGKLPNSLHETVIALMQYQTKFQRKQRTLLASLSNVQKKCKNSH